jgi:hypothetical protein
VAGAALALLVSPRRLQALKVPEVRSRRSRCRACPPLEGLRMAVLADIHASPVNDARYVQTIVERTLAARPDLIVLPGDMVDGDVATRPPTSPRWPLQARYGVWAAPATTSTTAATTPGWKFRRLGLNLLENRRALQIRGRTLAVSGIGDPAYGRLSNQNDNPAVAEGLPPTSPPCSSRPRARTCTCCWPTSPSPRATTRSMAWTCRSPATPTAASWAGPAGWWLRPTTALCAACMRSAR